MVLAGRVGVVVAPLVGRGWVRFPVVSCNLSPSLGRGCGVRFLHWVVWLRLFVWNNWVDVRYVVSVAFLADSSEEGALPGIIGQVEGAVLGSYLGWVGQMSWQLVARVYRPIPLMFGLRLFW